MKRLTLLLLSGCQAPVTPQMGPQPWAFEQECLRAQIRWCAANGLAPAATDIVEWWHTTDSEWWCER